MLWKIVGGIAGSLALVGLAYGALQYVERATERNIEIEIINTEREIEVNVQNAVRNSPRTVNESLDYLRMRNQ